jgi:integrase
MLPREIEQAISAWEPRLENGDVVDFCRHVVLATQPVSCERAKDLLWACSKLAIFALGRGCPLEPDVIFDDSMIERFILLATAWLSPATKRTLRTNLRFIARKLKAKGPLPTPLCREQSKRPYTKTQLEGYLSLADAQPTKYRQMCANALICLGAGAGLIGSDLRSVRGSDVLCRSRGVIVKVHGDKPRIVPVLSWYHDRLLRAATFAGDRWLISAGDPRRTNVTTPITSVLVGGRDLPRIETGRLRATWLVACGEQLGLKAFMDAAGIMSSQRLGDLVASMDAVDEVTAVRILGALR